MCVTLEVNFPICDKCWAAITSTIPPCPIYHVFQEKCIITDLIRININASCAACNQPSAVPYGSDYFVLSVQYPENLWADCTADALCKCSKCLAELRDTSKDSATCGKEAVGHLPLCDCITCFENWVVDSMEEIYEEAQEKVAEWTDELITNPALEGTVDEDRSADELMARWNVWLAEKSLEYILQKKEREDEVDEVEEVEEEDEEKEEKVEKVEDEDEWEGEDEEGDLSLFSSLW